MTTLLWVKETVRVAFTFMGIVKRAAIGIS
jgi:hypothetical protein